MEVTARVDRLEYGLAQLAAAQARTEATLAQLVEAQTRTEARVEQLAAALVQLVQAQTRMEAQVEQLAAAQTQLTEAQRRTEARVEQLVEAQTRTETRLEQLVAAQTQLTEAQTRTEARVEELADAQTRTETRLEQLAAAQTQLTEAQRRTEQQLGTLIAWQQGERGRRAGEQYELRTVRRAHIVFGIGEGGTADQDPVRRRLMALLAPLLDDELPPEQDPSLADLLWWKGEHGAVVEVSQVVDEHDVDRAFRRAETIRRGGAPAVGVVVGEAWADLEIRETARLLRVAWKVGNDVSDDFVAFRRLPATG